MPGGNRTGPQGMGPMTGWGRGMCNPSQTANDPSPAQGPGYRGSGYGQGFGRGRGVGRGRGLGRGRGQGRGFGRRGAYAA